MPFKDHVNSHALHCPRGTTYLVTRLFRVQEEKDLIKNPAFRKINCQIYKELSEKVKVSTNQIKQIVEEGIKLIEHKISESDGPVILLIGENHNSQATLLIEMLLLTHLKENHNIDSLLFELGEQEVNDYKNIPISKVADPNIAHFSLGYLGLDLISADVDDRHNLESLSPTRERIMVKKISDHAKQSGNKVVVGVFGLMHLPTLDSNLAKKGQKVISININPEREKQSNFDLKSEFTLREETLSLVNKINVGRNLESMTREQIFDIYDDVIRGDKVIYKSIGLKECEFSGIERMIEPCNIYFDDEF